MGRGAGRVEVVEPPHRLAYRWAAHHARDTEPAEGTSTRVEFTLEPEAGGTRLRVVETGFAALRDQRGERAPQPRGQRRRLARGPAHARRVRDAGGGLSQALPPEVFAALADPTRWRVLTLIAERGEGTATTLAGALPVSRVAVVKHLAVLDRAGLVEGRRAGREVRYTVRPERLGDTARWMAALAAEWDARLLAIKRIAEEG